METERPIRYFSWRPDDLRILPRDFGRVVLAASQKVEVEYAADDIVLKRRGAFHTVAAAADLDVHAGGAEEEDGVRAARRAVLKVHRVVPVEVRAVRDAIRIARPQRARRVGRDESERL